MPIDVACWDVVIVGGGRYTRAHMCKYISQVNFKDGDVTGKYTQRPELAAAHLRTASDLHK